MVFCLPASVWGQDAFKISHGPYLCNPEKDEMSIVWTTNRPAVSWVEIAPDDGNHFYAETREAHYVTRFGRVSANQTLHHVRLTGLTPGKTYRYRVLSKEVTEWKSRTNILYGKTVGTDVYQKKPLKFKTIDPESNDLTFLVLNDIHSRAANMKLMCKNVDFKQVDAIVLNGDMSSYVESEEQIFKDYIDTLVTMGASEIPLVFARGNHETRGVFSDELMRYFPTKDGNFYQQFNIGQTAFLIVDCGEDKPDDDVAYQGLSDYDAYREMQAKWLEKAVKNESYTSAKNRIIFSHMPMVGKKDDLWHGNLHLIKTTLPILNEANADVMFCGHNHRYSYYPKLQGVVNFPTLINDNLSYVLCHVKEGKIDVQIGNDKVITKAFPINY